MTIWEHLDELRKRLVRSVIAYIIGASVAWTYRDPILAWLWKPFAAIVARRRASSETLRSTLPRRATPSRPTSSCRSPAGCSSRRRSSFTSSGRSSRPGLYKKEKKVIIPFVFFSTVLFVGGGLFGWRVAFPVTFSYFLRSLAPAREQGSTFTPS